MSRTLARATMGQPPTTRKNIERCAILLLNVARAIVGKAVGSPPASPRFVFFGPCAHDLLGAASRVLTFIPSHGLADLDRTNVTRMLGHLGTAQGGAPARPHHGRTRDPELPGVLPGHGPGLRRRPPMSPAVLHSARRSA